jgi:putative ABC transport system permease protein
VGAYVRIHRSAVLVVGVMGPRGADSSGANMDEVLFVPVRAAMERFASQTHVTGFFLEMQSREAISALGRSLEGLLRQRHRLAPAEGNDFSVNFAGQVDEMVHGRPGPYDHAGLRRGGHFPFSWVPLAFSLHHDPPGALPADRDRHTTALGAPRRLIMQQFLFEAGLMAGAGGVLGVGVALGLLEAVAAWGLLPRYLNIPLPPQSVCCP